MRLLCLLIAAYMRFLCHNIREYILNKKTEYRIKSKKVSEIVARLGDFFSKKNLKIYRVEQEIGVSNGSIGSAIRDGRSIGSATIEKLISIYPINPIWLLTGQGPMVWEENLNAVSDPAQTYTKPSTATPEAEIIALQRKVITNLEEQMEKQKAANLLVGEMLLKLDGDIYAIANPQRQPFENLALKKEMIRVGLIKASVV